MSLSVAVALCARADADEHACRGALRAADEPNPIVVRAAPGHGLAVARNEALARCEADVIAYVDDDVLVGPRWRAALVAAWAAAPAATGAIGGPIGAVWRGERPGWLTDELLGILGASAQPASPSTPSAAIEPMHRTLRGGNLSFRTEALRGIRGFWPARGNPWARDWFTEEHEVQREIARAGWEVIEAPALEAVRLVDREPLRRADVLARRARSGARSSVVGLRRPPASAARGVLASALGAALAAGRGDSVQATARAARAAEGLGALAGALAVHRELQPVAGRTPFRHAVAAPLPSPLRATAERLRRPSRGCVPLVLLYHRVANLEDDPLGLAVTPVQLAADLELACEHRTPVALRDIALGRVPDDALAVTFDDGYADVLSHGLPVLEAAGVPATVFVSTGHVDEGRPFWWDELQGLMRRATPVGAQPLSLTLAGQTRSWPAHSARERDVAFAHLFGWLQPLAGELIDRALDTVAAWARAPRGVAEHGRALTRDELRRLAGSPFVAIGSHTRTHLNLAFATPERRRAELDRSRSDLEAWLGRTPEGFSYPYGVLGTDIDYPTRDAVARAGYRYAVTNDARAPRTDPFLLPRVCPGQLRAAWSPGAARRRS